MSDIRFTAIRPTMVGHSDEPSLYDIVYYYYSSNGFIPNKAAALTKEYIEQWCNIEKII